MEYINKNWCGNLTTFYINLKKLKIKKIINNILLSKVLFMMIKLVLF